MYYYMRNFALFVNSNVVVIYSLHRTLNSLVSRSIAMPIVNIFSLLYGYKLAEAIAGKV